MSASRVYGSNISLPSLDSLFSTEEERRDAALEKVQELPLDQLFPFPNHPFQVRDDEEMKRMVESVKEYGVLTPLIARPRPEGGYEIVAGHRRKRACELAGIETLPVLVREMDDDTAVIRMVDTNCQRENVSAIEKAKAYKMKLEAIKRKAGRPSKENSTQVGHNFPEQRSVQKVAEDANESKSQIQRFIRLNELIPPLQEMVEANRLKFQSEECTPSLSQAQQLKAASKEKTLDEERLTHIMTARAPSVAPREQQVSIPLAKLHRYFPAAQNSEQMIAQIFRVLDAYLKKRQLGQER